MKEKGEKKKKENQKEENRDKREKEGVQEKVKKRQSKNKTTKIDICGKKKIYIYMIATNSTVKKYKKSSQICQKQNQKNHQIKWK